MRVRVRMCVMRVRIGRARAGASGGGRREEARQEARQAHGVGQRHVLVNVVVCARAYAAPQSATSGAHANGAAVIADGAGAQAERGHRCVVQRARGHAGGDAPHGVHVVVRVQQLVPTELRQCGVPHAV